MNNNQLPLPQLPSVKDIKAAIQQRRGEIVELRELLRVAEVREARLERAGSPVANAPQSGEGRES